MIPGLSVVRATGEGAFAHADSVEDLPHQPHAYALPVCEAAARRPGARRSIASDARAPLDATARLEGLGRGAKLVISPASVAATSVPAGSTTAA
jgi:hypothetical protein